MPVVKTVTIYKDQLCSKCGFKIPKGETKGVLWKTRLFVACMHGVKNKEDAVYCKKCGKKLS